MNQEQQQEQDLKNLLESAECLRVKMEEYFFSLKSVQKQIKKYPQCKSCCKHFVAHQLRHFTKEELKSIEDMEDQQDENYSCYNRFREDELYCMSCIRRALQPV